MDSHNVYIYIYISQVDDVAGEDLTLKLKRTQFDKELKNLEDGKRILS